MKINIFETVKCRFLQILSHNSKTSDPLFTSIHPYVQQKRNNKRLKPQSKKTKKVKRT